MEEGERWEEGEEKQAKFNQPQPLIDFPCFDDSGFRPCMPCRGALRMFEACRDYTACIHASTACFAPLLSSVLMPLPSTTLPSLASSTTSDGKPPLRAPMPNPDDSFDAHMLNWSFMAAALSPPKGVSPMTSTISQRSGASLWLLTSARAPSTPSLGTMTMRTCLSSAACAVANLLAYGPDAAHLISLMSGTTGVQSGHQLAAKKSATSLDVTYCCLFVSVTSSWFVLCWFGGTAALISCSPTPSQSIASSFVMSVFKLLV